MEQTLNFLFDSPLRGHESDIDVEICEAVTELRPDTNLLKFKKMDAAACVLHKGN
ncbi:hypothetical protein ACM6L3_15900 [Paenibacillus larvae]